MDKDDESDQYLVLLLASIAKVSIDGNLSRFVLDTIPGNFFCSRTFLIRTIKEGLLRLFCIRSSPKNGGASNERRVSWSSAHSANH